MQHFNEGGNYLKVFRSQCVAALTHTNDVEGSKEFGWSLLSSLALFCLNRWPAGTGCSSFFYGANGRKTAFSNNNCSYFPIPSLVPIVF